MILRSTDGGENWFSQPSGTGNSLNDISFANENNGLIVGGGGTILKTTDGGVNWMSQASGTTNSLNGVSYIDTNIGTIVGHDGIILRTTDGGLNWFMQSSGITNAFYEVFFINTLIGTVVGSSGVILRTLDGGVPVELISFTAEFLESESVELTWSTATETNNSGFEIQRLQDSKIKKLKDLPEGETGWEKIGFVTGHGTTTETQHYSFTDNNVSPGNYQYKLKQIDFDGTFEYSQIVEVEIPLTNKFSLSQNYPNPFNPVTKIKFNIPSVTLRQAQSDIRVTLKIFDILGIEIITLVNEDKQAGEYEIEFDGSKMPSGIYYYQLIAGGFSETKKMVLLK